MTEPGESIIEQRGPFEVLDREILHDRFDMELVADTVRRPDGSTGQQFWINFPRGAVQIYPVDQEDNIYLAREFTYGTNEDSLEAAGGVIGKDETPEAAAIRKVKEELGLAVDGLRRLGTSKSITSRVYNPTEVFLANVTTEGEPKPGAGDNIRLEKMPFSEALELVRSGEVTTAITAAAIWKIHDLRQQESPS